MGRIATIEDTIIDKIKEVLGAHVKTVEWAPPDWDEDFIKRTLLTLPGVFVIFQGGPREGISEHTVVLDTRWTVVAATRHVQTAAKRARGDGLELSCYDILEALAPELDGLQVPDTGTLALTEWNNDAALKLEKQALMTQSLGFSLSVSLEKTFKLGDLSPFITYHDTFNVGQQPGAPTTEDNVELEQ